MNFDMREVLEKRVNKIQVSVNSDKIDGTVHADRYTHY